MNGATKEPGQTKTGAPRGGPPLHCAAAAWCERHGLADDALRHALAAGDAAWAARLVERHIAAELFRGEGATARRWMAALPAAVVESRPRLRLAQALQAIFAGRLRAAETLLDETERALAAGGDGVPEPAGSAPPETEWTGAWLGDVAGAAAVLRVELARMRGDPERTFELARRVLAGLPAESARWPGAPSPPPSSWNHARAHWMQCELARARWMRGELMETERALAEIAAARLAAGEVYLSLMPRWELGRVQMALGRLRAARRTFQLCLDLAREAGRPVPAALALGHVGLAELLCEQDELEAALHHVAEGIPLCRAFSSPLPLAVGLVTLARLRLAGGDPAGAQEAIAEAERVGPGAEVVTLFNPVAVQRARWLLAQGAVAEVARWTAERGLGVDDEPRYMLEAEHLILVRVCLAEGRPDQARRLLSRLRAAAAAGGRTGSVVALLALEALATDAAGDRYGALAALAEALELAWPEGYVRVFADEGAPMASLLARLAAVRERGRAVPAYGVPPSVLRRLWEACKPGAEAPRQAGQPAGEHGPASVPGLLEPLSGRELEVLRLLAAGRTNQQIAGQLVVALDTVKKHVSHILAKLGAANRTEAVAGAQELGLLAQAPRGPGATSCAPGGTAAASTSAAP